MDGKLICFEFYYRSPSDFNALALIGSGSTPPPANPTTILVTVASVFAGAAFVTVILVYSVGFIKNVCFLHTQARRNPHRTREMEVERSFDPSSYQGEPGEPMLVDGLEQGLPFPHVVRDDGQHSIQCIDM